MARIDPRAAVSPKAQLADDVEVGPFAVIGDDVVIGPRCRIGPHAVVNGPTTLGADNQVFQFASLGDAPQDKKYKGEPTRLEVGDRNIFREYVTVNRGTTTTSSWPPRTSPTIASAAVSACSPISPRSAVTSRWMIT